MVACHPGTDQHYLMESERKWCVGSHLHNNQSHHQEEYLEAREPQIDVMLMDYVMSLAHELNTQFESGPVHVIK